MNIHEENKTINEAIHLAIIMRNYPGSIALLCFSRRGLWMDKSYTEMTWFIHPRSKQSPTETKDKHVITSSPSQAPYPEVVPAREGQAASENSVMPLWASSVKAWRTSKVFIIFWCLFWLQFIFVNFIFCLTFENQFDNQATNLMSPVFSQLPRTMSPCFCINLQLSYRREMCSARSIQKVPIARPTTYFKIHCTMVCFFQLTEYIPEQK